MIKKVLQGWWARFGSAPDTERAVPSALELSAEDDPPWSEPTAPLVLPLEDVIDLHPFAPREIRSVVEEYLSACCQAGLSTVRLIHGKGRGVQRNSIRALLARLSYVESYQDAPPEAGGWGATVVTLKPPFAKKPGP